MTNDPLAVDAVELGRLLGISRALVWKLHSQGKLPPPRRFGRCTRWLVSDIGRWLDLGQPDRATFARMREGK